MRPEQTSGFYSEYAINPQLAGRLCFTMFIAYFAINPQSARGASHTVTLAYGAVPL